MTHSVFGRLNVLIGRLNVLLKRRTLAVPVRAYSKDVSYSLAFSLTYGGDTIDTSFDCQLKVRCAGEGLTNIETVGM